MVTLDAGDPLSAELRDAVSATIAEFIAGRSDALAPLGDEADELTALAASFTAGGKRLRPAFCCWGYAAATGSTGLPHAVLRAAASLDLLHVSALVHDDVMDGSATRRGLASAHVQFGAQHAARDGRGAADQFGRAAAILLGDLLLMWSVELFEQSGASASQVAAAGPLLAAMRAEVTAGQYLDIRAQARRPGEARSQTADVLDQVGRVVEYKTARYTVIRPLQVGAALGGGSPDLLDALAAFGSPLGRAFQFRDDVLGLFGDETVTGKPAGDDLREGKLTVLVARAMAAAEPAAASRLEALLGQPLTEDQVAEARAIIVECGALAQTEADIAAAASAALDVLRASIIAEPARTALTELVRIATQRDS